MTRLESSQGHIMQGLMEITKEVRVQLVQATVKEVTSDVFSGTRDIYNSVT